MDPKFIGKTKISSQGQITVPSEARSDLSLSPESELYTYVVDDVIIIVKELMNQKDLKEKLKNKSKK